MTSVLLRPIDVMIVDDHAVVRSGLSTFLGVHDDINLIAVASGGSEAIHKYLVHRPNVTLMDLVMPDMEGVLTIKRIRDFDTTAKIIALTSFSDSKLIKAALAAGAAGYLLKDISGDDLADAVRRVFQGEAAISAGAKRVLRDEQKPDAFVDELSGREIDVLRLVVDGCTNQQIAYELQLKPSTVKTYISRIFTKLDVTSRVEATSVALKYNLLD